MFTREEASSLRQQLPPMNFGQTTVRFDLLTRYRTHYRLFFPCHPSPTNTCPSEEAHAGTTEHQSVDHHIGLLHYADYDLVCQYFVSSQTQPQGTWFLLHGYFDHTGLYGSLIEHGLRSGFGVVIFDLPGHGLSTGSQASINSFREYLESLRICFSAAAGQLAQPWSLIGQSTGAAIILEGLLDQPQGLPETDILNQLVLLCPLVYPAQWCWSKLGYSLLRHFVPSVPRRFSNNSHDKTFLRFLRQVDSLQSQQLPVSWITAMIDYQRRFDMAQRNNRPIHIIQGTGDTTVDWKRNIRLIQDKFPATSTILIPNAHHHLVNEADPYRQQVFTEINRILGC